MTPTQLAALLATVGLAFLAQSLACASLLARVRSLARRLDPPTPPPDPAVDQAGQVRDLADRLARLERDRDRALAAPPADAPRPADARRTRRLDRPRATADGPVLIAVPSLALPPAAGSTLAAAAEFDRRFGAIWALADAGAPDDEIARRTGYPVGQVELIRGLRTPRAGEPPPAPAPPTRPDPPRDAPDA